MNIAGQLDRVTRDLPTQPAIIFDGRTICYAQLWDEVDRTAHALTTRGVQKGNRIALFSCRTSSSSPSGTWPRKTSISVPWLTADASV
jgi:acyl-coenzyme A synthetase/AMP-(fatty) acid ligase